MGDLFLHKTEEVMLLASFPVSQWEGVAGQRQSCEPGGGRHCRTAGCFLDLRVLTPCRPCGHGDTDPCLTRLRGPATPDVGKVLP